MLNEADDGSSLFTFQSIDCEGTEVRVTFRAIAYDKVVDNFKQFSIGAGYHPDTIAKYIDAE